MKPIPIRKPALLLTFLTATSLALTACSLHDDEWMECVPLPETEIPVESLPWEREDAKENPPE